MSNSTTTNPIVIDTFTSDVTISSVPIPVKSIRFWADTAEDFIILQDKNGKEVYRERITTANQIASWEPSKSVCFSSLTLKANGSGSTITSNAKLWIYS